jgi:hypothetical protein
MHKFSFLLPRNFRFVGIFFCVLGFLLGIARFKYGFKPDSLDLKMFAFYSSYLESKYMEIVSNNMAEEITGFFLLTGLFLIAFSREKTEKSQYMDFRLKSFFIAAYLNFLFLIFSLLFTFGFAFIYMLMINMGFGLLTYFITFQIQVIAYLRKLPAQ